MELPSRERGNILLAPGEMLALRKRLRRLAPRHDLATVIACANPAGCVGREDRGPEYYGPRAQRRVPDHRGTS